MDWLETLAHSLVTWSGNGFDPEGCPLPAFKAKQEPRAALPKQPKKVAEIRDDGLLTDEELATPNWRYTWNGMNEKQLEKHKAEIKASKAVEVDFDETPSDMYGITEREYGEMLAYDPPLRNLKLASEVKRLRQTNTLPEVARILGEKEQLVKHYSSALTKASPSPARK